MSKTESKAAATKPATNAEKYPELWKTYTALQKEKVAILKKVDPLREKREKLIARIQPLENEARALDAKIRDLSRPRLGEIDNQISGLARAMGGRRMSESGTE